MTGNTKGFIIKVELYIGTIDVPIVFFGLSCCKFFKYFHKLSRMFIIVSINFFNIHT